MTQSDWTHPRWTEANDTWFTQCQSCVKTTFLNFFRRLLITGMTWLPSGTAKLPPSKKQFCTSMISRADFSPILMMFCTGKSLSEALIFASTNPQYDDRLFTELQVQYMKIPSSNLGRTCCVQKLFLTFRTIFVHNMFSPCSAKRRNSDKDLDVLLYLAKLDRD